MASGWLSWGSDPFAELVEKATSELLPPNHEDVALNLEICDQIRAKQVQPKHAAQTIKRRLGHSNPNVVLLTLGLTDICIKNSGDHFLAEVGSAEFMDNLVSILNAPTGPGKNVDVRNKLLRLIQSWAQVADARPTQMSYVSKTYADLKKRGFPFPPPDPSHVVSAALVDTLTAPEWVDGDVCLRCRQPFTTFTRKHHCRNCGNVFCHACSSNTMALPWFGVGQDVRVCDGCHTSRGPPSNARRAKPAAPTPASKDGDLVSSASLARSSTVGAGTGVRSSGRGGVGNAYHTGPQRSNTVTATSSSSRRKREEDDIALAIKLSLEGSSKPSAGYVPSAPSVRPASSAPAPAASTARGPSGRIAEGTDAAGDEDPDLAAAIAASLRDYAAPQPSAPSGFSDVGSVASMPPTPAPQSERSMYDGGSYLSNGSYAGSNAYGYGQQYPQQQQPAPAPAPQQSSLPLPPSIELPSQDIDSLLSFSQTVLRAEEAAAQSQGHPYSIQQLHQTISDQRTQGLYERAQVARPKMARSLDEAGRRHNVLVGMHEKLTEAVKLYNRLLDAQMGRGPQIVYGGAPAPQPTGVGQAPSQYQYADPAGAYGHAAASAPSPQPPSAAAGPAPGGMYPALPQGPLPGPATPQASFQQAQHSGYASLYPAPVQAAVPAGRPAYYDPSQQPPQQQQPPYYAYTAPGQPSYYSYGAPQVQSPVQAEASLAPAVGTPGVGGAPSAPAQVPAPAPPAASAPAAQLYPAAPTVNGSLYPAAPASEAVTASSAAALASAPSVPTWTPASAAALSGLPTSPSTLPPATQPLFAPQQQQQQQPTVADASVPSQAASTQEPWRREDERPLIDL
ncbi:Vacuolar protein-sorting-associated protein 27 [Tilletia horrida]|nr:Vacuolar protein-sorting-associated protein 27 [Tilletia horrida]